MELESPCDKNGPVQMGTSYISVGLKNGQKVATVDPMERHVQESSRTAATSSENPGANVLDTHNIRKTSIKNSARIRKSGYNSVFSDANANLSDRSVYYKFSV